MKTFNKTFLPESIKYNGQTYTLNTTISDTMRTSGTTPNKVLEALKSTGAKGVVVSVLSKNLRGVNDLHGKPYKPSIYIFTNGENNSK